MCMVVYRFQDFVGLEYNNSTCQMFVLFNCHVHEENISQLKKQLQNVEEALDATRQSGKNEEHKSNLLLAEKVCGVVQFCC